jgi:alcohol dehydrogenase, propanol-preferring
MKAVLLDKPAPIERHPLRIAEVPTPRPGRGELLVKVAACGVCRSNLHMIEGDWVAYGVPAKSPIVPGHEIVGTVAELGDGATGFTIGERVGVQPLWSTCGRCEYCLTGREQLCRTKQITGETVDGGYAEYLLARAEHAYPVPDTLDPAAAAPLFCPGITAYGAVAKAAPRPGERVALFGVGGVGHMVIQIARLSGADVIAVARSRQHLALAEELGATESVDASQVDPGEVLSKRGGVDASIVFAPSSAVVAQAVRATKPGGTVVLGVFASVGELPFADEKRVVGSVIGSRQQMREVIALAAAGKIRVVHEDFPLDKAEETLLRLKRGEVRARAVLVV